MNRLTLFLPVTFMVLISCSPKQMNEQELRKYMLDEKNGVKKEIVDANQLKLEVYLVRSELINDKKKEDKKDSLRYFMLAFSKNDREALAQYAGQNNYAQLVENLSFNAAKYCRLIINKKDTVQVSNYSFINNYGTSPSNNLLLVFDAPLPESEYELDVDDPGFDISDSKFIFKKTDIKTYYNIKLIK
ncbi:hypothetical protein SNE26_28195 [Mucilaginibacter sp. cycad4]|uniref:hypothetical protein n=1 Tax=Mucilaginibacter sp. cycad4 TaxID=3342096 RepID=UPI002AAB3F39|nr:hypothetical protein [Mucilaginibacter gossypii]WPU99894.1 hypothetical protein SNE26_28195 [Mucilaginibacter gossypii]